MKITPLWGKCDVCDGTGTIIKQEQIGAAGATQDVKQPCLRCNETGKIRTDSLHRVVCLDEDGDALWDLSFEPAGEMVCASSKDKNCGALCAAFKVQMSEDGLIHYATCAAMANHIIGVLEVESE